MRLLLFAALPLLFACASARMSDHVSDNLFRERKYDEAAAKLREGLAKEGDNGRDRLLYLMDLGLSLHAAGRCQESNQVFLEADRLADIKDYTSLSKEAATLFTSDNIKDYKGEDFENVLINTYLAMNYAMLGDLENALVEAKRVNRKLYLMVSQGERKYKQNAFARYLSAVAYEADGDYNNAYVDYKETYKLQPDFPELRRDLWRMAFVMNEREDCEKWDEQFGLTAEDHDAARAQLPKTKLGKGKGEIVVLYENGVSPVKRPHPNFHMVPKFYPRLNPVLMASVELDNQPKGLTAKLHDIEATAIENLDEKYAGIVAKKIAGVVAKEVVGHQIEKQTKSPLLGFLARAVMYASDQADVRSWNLLPRDLQMIRLTVEAGTHVVRIVPVGAAEAKLERMVEVRPGKKVFVNFRYMP